jgi:ATP-dependent protease ClpP protease subunit
MNSNIKAIALAVVAALAWSTSSPAETVKLNPKRLIEIIDAIDGSAIEQAQALHDMASKSKEPIDILINSPGGAVIPGYMFTDAMDAARAKGVKIRCAVGVLAASMAFNTLAHCDERYALRHAALLFHPPRIFARGPMTAGTLEAAARDLNRIIASSTQELIDMLGMNRSKFAMHFNEETLWTAEQLLAESGHDWIRIVDDIKGSNKVFTHQKPQLMLFFRSSTKYEILHISPVSRRK